MSFVRKSMWIIWRMCPFWDPRVQRVVFEMMSVFTLHNLSSALKAKREDRFYLHCEWRHTLPICGAYTKLRFSQNVLLKMINFWTKRSLFVGIHLKVLVSELSVKNKNKFMWFVIKDTISQNRLHWLCLKLKEMRSLITQTHVKNLNQKNLGWGLIGEQIKMKIVCRYLKLDFNEMQFKLRTRLQ